MKDPIIIFTDGSSRGNPGPGGYAAVIYIPEDDRIIELGGRENKTTNNRMELQAVIDAALAIRKFPGDIVINSDSKYVIQGMTAWVKTWIQNGWVTSAKEDVQNRDLWELLTSLLYEREEKWKIEWKYVVGHAGIPGNERCDVIATAFADGKDTELFDGSASDYEVNILSTVEDPRKKRIEGNRR